MSSIEQRLEYLEEANDVLRMQNHVLATALKGLIRSLPSDMANEAVANVVREVAELRPVVDNVVVKLQEFAAQLEGVKAELAALQIDNASLNEAAAGLDQLAASLSAALPPAPPPAA